jgi:predicted phosphoribosyltransferase/dienelactone hydrolase
MIFTDRHDAGIRLAARLQRFRGESTLVLGLPRGGVPVAHEVARALGAPLDLLLVRKLGVPFQPELAMGAIGESGVRVLDERVVRDAGVTPAEIAQVEKAERAELRRRGARYRAGRPAPAVAGRVVIIVDDGIATGSTARAACRVARAGGAAWVVLAAPVAAPGSPRELAADADEVVVLQVPSSFLAIGQFYEDFAQVTDEEVLGLLATSTAPVVRSSPIPGPASDPPALDADVRVPADGVRMDGHLTIPEHARGVVVFAHGTGSGRHSPRNQQVAAVLQRAALGTLLMDLLTTAEERDRANVFDIERLGRRLAAVTRWLRGVPEAVGLPIGYFGGSTGAAAALFAAAEPESVPAAIVSRGGRPDLAASRLGAVRAPTLLIVGELDRVVLELNRSAQARLRCESRLALVPGATHLFEEPGTLQAAAELARDWFVLHLGSERHAATR